MASFLRRWVLNAAIAGVVAVLGAIPLADASGFDRGRYGHSDPLTSVVLLCGALLFVLTLATLGPLWRGLSALASSLNRTEARPTQAVALGLLGAGTLCVITSLYFAWAARTMGPVADAARQMHEAARSVQQAGITFNMTVPDVAAQAGSGAGAMILTTLVFALGVGLIGLGVWAVLPPITGPSPIKRPIPAADAVSL